MTMSFGFPFYLECTLSKGSEELVSIEIAIIFSWIIYVTTQYSSSNNKVISTLQYFQKVTHPLLKIICDLRESQSELRHLLIKKDSEIEEYKCEGGEIVLSKYNCLLVVKYHYWRYTSKQLSGVLCVLGAIPTWNMCQTQINCLVAEHEHNWSESDTGYGCLYMVGFINWLPQEWT